MPDDYIFGDPPTSWYSDEIQEKVMDTIKNASVEKLQKYWTKYPCLRLFQVMEIIKTEVYKKHGYSDIFFLEDDKLEKLLDSLNENT